MHSTQSTHSRIAAEDGIALFYALLVVLVVGGIIAVTFAAALTETRQAAFELDFEDTLHVAEAGAERALQELNSDYSFTNASDPTGYAGTEEQWAVNEASDPARTPMQVGEGETVWLRPSSGRTEYIYGVGFTPSRDAYFGSVGESFARVVRMQIAFTDPLASGTYAFLSDRMLTFSGGGDSSIYGSNGSAHTNGTFNAPSSSNFTFEGTVSFHDCNGGGCSTPGYAETDTVVPLNVGTPEEVYRNPPARNYITDGGDWYDYCGGTWKTRISAAASPCEGPDVGGNPPGFTGTTQNSAGASGVYWFQGETNVQLAADDVEMTVITGGDINLPTGGATFDWVPAHEKLHAYAGNNVNWGNANVNSTELNCSDGLSDAERSEAAAVEAGIVYAGNNLSMGGNPTAVQIAFLAENDVIFTGGGGRCIVLETDASGNVGGKILPIVTEWDELQ